MGQHASENTYAPGSPRHNAYRRCRAARAAGAISFIALPINTRLLASVGKDRHGGSPTSSSAHVGDGNFHFGYLISPAMPRALSAEQLNHRLVALALSMGGACTGEHGDGRCRLGLPGGPRAGAGAMWT